MKNIILSFFNFSKGVRISFTLLICSLPLLDFAGNSVYFQVEINNQLNEKIAGIQLSQNNVLVENLIVEKEFIASKTCLYFFVRCEIYDIKITTESGKEIVLSGVNLCEQNKQLTISPILIQKSNL